MSSETTTIAAPSATQSLKTRLLTIASDVIAIGMPTAEKVDPTATPMIEASAVVLEGLMALLKAL